MIIVDSSVWIDHLRSAIEELSRRLLLGEIIQHSFVTTELALGSLADRKKVISRLAALPQISPVAEFSLLAFIEGEQLAGTGIGLVDTHLLAACREEHHKLWTRDKRLKLHAERLGCAYSSE